MAALIVSRLLLDVGESCGFPAATRAIVERFAPASRATAMRMVNAGTSGDAVIAPPLIALLLTHADWFGQASWLWVFFVTGAIGLAWAIWWALLARREVQPLARRERTAGRPRGAQCREPGRGGPRCTGGDRRAGRR